MGFSNGVGWTCAQYKNQRKGRGLGVASGISSCNLFQHWFRSVQAASGTCRLIKGITDASVKLLMHVHNIRARARHSKRLSLN